MDMITIVHMALIILGFMITTAIPFIISLVKTIKKRKNLQAQAYAATTEAEKAMIEAEQLKAENDMLTILNGFIGDVEGMYKGVDAILKQQGASGGAVKKDSVMTKLQTYAIEKGYRFNADFWNTKIDEIITFTKQVNAK